MQLWQAGRGSVMGIFARGQSGRGERGEASRRGSLEEPASRRARASRCASHLLRDAPASRRASQRARNQAGRGRSRARTLLRSNASSRHVDSFGHEWSARGNTQSARGLLEGTSRERRAFGEPVPRAERRRAQLAVADDPDGRLRAPVRRVQHEPAPLLGRAAAQPQREPDRVALGDPVRRERPARDELRRAKDEALVLDWDRGAVCDGILQGRDVACVCGTVPRVSPDGREGGTKAADAPNESEWPERSRTKRCMVERGWT